MKIKNLLRRSYWLIDRKTFNEMMDYDTKFNASFRGVAQLPKDVLESVEFQYIRLYRMTQCARGTIWYRFLYKKLYKQSLFTGIALYCNMNIPKGLIIGHLGTIRVNYNSTFGGNLVLTHGVTIGRDVRGKRAGAPRFGKNVVIRCYSTIVGNITIGDDVLIAPNTFVNFDVPSHSIVIGNPATIHHRDNATEGHIGVVKD